MTTTDDTKQQFANALRALMIDTSFSKISVSDISEKAGLSRKSFYNHFHDKYDLINQICYTQFVDIQQGVLTGGGWDAFRAFLEFFASDTHFFSNAIQDMSQNSFGQYFSDLLFEVVYATAAEGFKSRVQSEKWVGLAIAALVENARLAILIWLNESSEPSVDELIDFLCSASDAFASMICFDRVLRIGGELCDHAIDNLTDSWRPTPDEENISLPKPDQIGNKRQDYKEILSKYDCPQH